MPLPAGMALDSQNVWAGINDIAKNDVYVYDSSNETGRASIDIKYTSRILKLIHLQNCLFLYYWL